MVGELGVLVIAPEGFSCADTRGMFFVVPILLLGPRILPGGNVRQTPLQDIAKVLDVPIPSIGDPHYDDTSLALLFSQLKMKTLQTAKGTSEISGRTEFNFVLQIARAFCRMGTHSPNSSRP